MASQYMARLRAQQTDPDELCQMVTALRGDVLRGFGRAIEKALLEHKHDAR